VPRGDNSLRLLSSDIFIRSLISHFPHLLQFEYCGLSSHRIRWSEDSEQHKQQGAGSVAASPDQAVVEFDYEI